MDRDHVVVNHGGSGLGFEVESLASGGTRGQVAGQYLDRHAAIKRGVPRLENYSHSAATDNLFDFVVAQPAEHAGPVGRREKVKRWGIIVIRRSSHAPCAVA